MTPHERRRLIDAPFPRIDATGAQRIPSKSWAGVYIRSERLGVREQWIALEDETRLRQLLHEQDSGEDSGEDI